MKLSRVSHLLSIGGVATVANMAYLVYMDPHRPLRPDGSFYLAIARSLAQRLQYLDPSSPWPNLPAMARLPAWPFFVSVFLRVTPGIDPHLVIRLSGALLNVLTAVILALLTERLFSSRRAAIVAGLFYALYPPPLYLMDLGLSESFFVFLTVLAAWCAVKNEKLWTVSALLFGVGCLVRSNFILMAAFFPLVGWLRLRFAGRPLTLGHARRAALLVICFLLPSSLWVARNYAVSGHFPVLSAMRGETFYGAYNDIAANNLGLWGYWVYPPEIPGEIDKRVLAAGMSDEAVLDDYYFKKGKEYAITHKAALPRLVLGRLIRAYIPVPWVPAAADDAVAALRIALYVIFAATFSVWRRTSGPIFNVLLLTMTLVSVSGVVLFYGSPRFAFVLEVFFVPCAAFGLTASGGGLIARWRERMGIEPTQPDVVRSHQF